MEVKSRLQKPFTEKQRLDFMVSENHQKGYEIKETDKALESWGPTAQEQEESKKQKQKAELIAQLDEIDLKTIRPLRAIQSADFTDDDVAKLQELQNQASQIRAQLQELGE